MTVLASESERPEPPRRTVGRFTLQFESYEATLASNPISVISLENAHWGELVSDEPLEGDRDYYIALERRQRFVFMTVRDQQGSLVGYLKAVLEGDPKRRTKKIVREDGWYLRPEVRKGRLGVVMVSFLEETLGKLGVDELLLTAYYGTRAADLIDRLAYEPRFLVYRKTLGG